jgi:hypothetical protein
MKPTEFNAIRQIAILSAMACCTACTYFEVELTGPEKLDTVTINDQGETIDTVLAELGPPNRLGRAGSGLVFLYEYARVEEHQVGLHFAQDWVNLFKVAMGRGDLFSRTLFVVFDEKDTVLSHSFEEGEEELGTGVSVQLFFSAVPVVDTDNLQFESPHHLWGGGLLQPLPILLNSRNSMDSGIGGVESMDTPSGAGQRSLGSP